MTDKYEMYIGQSRAKITNPYGPNMTLLLPGDCSSSCSFCFWNKDTAGICSDDYIDKAFNHVYKASKAGFSTLSISGGEPTESPLFEDILKAIKLCHGVTDTQKVVLTTNGSKLENFLGKTCGSVNHINISRHGIGDKENYRSFKSMNIPTDADLERVIGWVHQNSFVDITFNCVVKSDITEEFCVDYIKYAKGLGADAVSFRKIASDTTPTNAESAFAEKYGYISDSKCPVCRGASMDVDGFDVRWKGTVNEPSIQSRGLYELVVHPDGELYCDWRMMIPVEIREAGSGLLETYEPVKRNTFDSGCGTTGC